MVKEREENILKSVFENTRIKLTPFNTTFCVSVQFN
jgi:hypothetical protein